MFIQINFVKDNTSYSYYILNKFFLVADQFAYIGVECVKEIYTVYGSSSHKEI